MSTSVPYVDLQVNGYAGVDFNGDELPAEDFHRACEAIQRDGVSAFLPTIITEALDVMERRLRRLAQLRNDDSLAQKLVPGFHIEGPFISPMDGYRGAHPKDAVCSASVSAMQRLLDAAGGLTRIVTLAPEQDPDAAVTRFLADQGIRVSAGHSNASLDELRRAIDAGLSMFTHLGNGCPMQQSRHDNIIQRVLSLADHLTMTFIADGVHVPFPALGNYLRLAGVDRSIVISDAITAAGLGPGRYRMGRWQVTVGDDLAVRAPDGSHLIGSALPLRSAADNLKTHLGLDRETIEKLTSSNATRLIC